VGNKPKSDFAYRHPDTLRRQAQIAMEKRVGPIPYVDGRDKECERLCYFMLSVFGRTTWLHSERPGTKSSYDRPTVFTPEVATEFIRRMVENGENLVQVCTSPDMPAKFTVFRWFQLYPDFKSKVDEARAFIAYAQEQKIIENVDGMDKDNMAVNTAKISALKWLTAVSNPKTFAPKQQTQIDNNVTITQARPLTELEIAHLSNEELDALESALRKTIYAQIEGPSEDGDKADGAAEQKRTTGNPT
jgi:hypothetical protein